MTIVLGVDVHAIACAYYTAYLFYSVATTVLIRLSVAWCAIVIYACYNK